MKKDIDVVKFDKVYIPRGHKVYKYMSLNDYDIQNIIKGKIYLQTAKNFNDVFDTVAYIDEVKFKEFLSAQDVSFFKSIYPELEGMDKTEIIDILYDYQVSGFKSQFVITCFSRSSTSPMMWGKYTNNYQGCMIEYDSQEILNATYNFLKENITLTKSESISIIDYLYLYNSVNYKQIRPDVTETLLEEYNNFFGEQEDILGLLKIDKFKNDKWLLTMINYYFTKSKAWEYEKEFRLAIRNLNYILDNPNKDYNMISIDVNPVSITITMQTSETHKYILFNYCRDRNIELYIVLPDFNKKIPKMKRVKISDEYKRRYYF